MFYLITFIILINHLHQKYFEHNQFFEVYEYAEIIFLATYYSVIFFFFIRSQYLVFNFFICHNYYYPETSVFETG